MHFCDQSLQVKQIRVKVEEARSSLQSAKTHNKVIDALMSLKRNGRMPGIYGRLVRVYKALMLCCITFD